MGAGGVPRARGERTTCAARSARAGKSSVDGKRTRGGSAPLAHRAATMARSAVDRQDEAMGMMSGRFARVVLRAREDAQPAARLGA